MIQIAGHVAVGEGSAGLGANLALGVAAREVGQDEVLHAGITGQRGGAGGGHVAELGRHLPLLFQVCLLYTSRCV